MSKNLVGKTIRQHYSLVKQLNCRDFSSIYLARDTFSAVGGKYVVRHFFNNYEHEIQLATARDLFLQSGEQLQQLGNHPQIPRVRDFFEEDNSFFLVREFIEGDDFRQELSTLETFEQPQIIQLLIDVLGALNFVHESGYIHGNIKPSSLIRNLFDKRMFLLDFCAIENNIAPQNIDEQGNSVRQAICSSLGYAAPEQLNLEPKFSSDIYALGMVAIEAMTGVEPASLARDSSSKLQWRDRLKTEYDRRLLHLVEQMVEFDWRDRHTDIPAIIAELEQLNYYAAANDETIQDRSLAPAETTIESSQKPSKKSAVLTNENIIRLVTVLGIISIACVGFWQFKQSRKIELASYANKYVSLKYPASWTKQERDGFSNTSIILTSPKENPSDRFQERVAVIVEESSRPLSLSEYTNQAIFQIKSLNNTIVSPPEATVLDSSDGKSVVYEGLDQDIAVKRLEVWTVNYKQVYTVIYTAEMEEFKSYLPEVEEIIESLEILRSTRRQ